MEVQWGEEYDRLLEKAIAEGKVEPLRDHDERRDSPRFKFSEGFFHSKELTQRHIIDLSKSGYAFHSDRMYNIGEEISLSIRDAFEAHAIVVNCEIEETDAGFLEYKYRVRCRFTNPEYGLMILVLLIGESTITGETQPNVL